MIKRLKPFYDEEQGTGNTPAAPAPEPQQAASAVAEHVEEAAASASQAASETGDQGWKVIADELKGLRSDISGLRDDLKASAKKPEKTESKAASSAAAPVVAAPPAIERYVYRNGRRVKRVGA